MFHCFFVGKQPVCSQLCEKVPVGLASARGQSRQRLRHEREKEQPIRKVMHGDNSLFHCLNVFLWHACIIFTVTEQHNRHTKIYHGCIKIHVLGGCNQLLPQLPTHRIIGTNVCFRNHPNFCTKSSSYEFHSHAQLLFRQAIFKQAPSPFTRPSLKSAEGR